MEPFLGQLMCVGFGFAQRGFATCEGQLLPISQNSALFSLLGTTFGGDGRTTFALPDLRGRVPIGRGNGPGLQSISWGQKLGTNTNTLTANNIPSIPMKVSSANATQNAATNGASIATPGAISGRTFAATAGFNASSPDITLNNATVSGNGQSVNNMQPSLGLYWVIATQGVYPSRN